jgi:toxin ParE1/3/4
MTLTVVFHERAESEMNEAAAYYARARVGIGEAFLAEAKHTVDVLAATSLPGSAGDGEVRRRLIDRFPYCIVYRMVDDHLRILAIGHQKRRPLYRHDRR